MDTELFRKWFVEHFLKSAAQECPLLLVMDGHSHLDPELFRTAQRQEVHTLVLGTTHVSHPSAPECEFFWTLEGRGATKTFEITQIYISWSCIRHMCS